jgi:hypothetical protein
VPKLAHASEKESRPIACTEKSGKSDRKNGTTETAEICLVRILYVWMEHGDLPMTGSGQKQRERRWKRERNMSF